jgi:amino acid adenylation domain-containing protein
MTTALVPFTPNVCSLLPAKWANAGILPQHQNYEPSIAEMVAAQAAATPDAAALVCTDEILSYAELDRRANRVANYLVRLGVQAETMVAVCLNRSAESIISTLAIMKAGAAFLPLDPKYPIDRLRFMLGDAQPRALITNQDWSDRLSDGSRRVINIARQEQFANESIEAPIVETDPDQLAYVIYTSGSTGEPKGVEITHAGLRNLVSWHRRTFQVSAGDRASHLAGVGFDASVWEVWPYLTAGASLHLPDDETRISPAMLRDWMVENKITISFLPTALAESVMILDWPDATSLRFLLTGADTLHRYPTSNLPFTVVNNYGPTECTVVATSGIVSTSNPNDALPTIGRPIDNVEVYILDENLDLVADGEEGEICIGGIGVARGYLNRPELTAEKFVADPARARTAARLYRTGDRARRLPNGEIAYLGRADDQIKIRGYRIEPAEIEAAIDRHPAVAASVVIARGSDCSDQRLTAYLALRNGTTPTATELREFLSSSLPDYMLPSLFVKIPDLPLTNNGKVDRAALAGPTVENTLRDDEFVAPRSPIENKLSEIVCALLKLDRVSVNDNFFLLGGHSLLGTQLIVKLRNAFGVDLALRTLFDASTIAELSAEIERLIVARIESMSDEEAEALLA